MALYGDWKRAGRKLNALAAASDKGLKAGIKEAAHGYRKFLVEGLTGNKFGLAPKSSVTLESEPGKANPLMRHGDFVRSIKAVSAAAGRVHFTGVQKNAKSRHGRFLYDIARFHEYGGTIRPVTAKSLSIPLTRKASRAGSPRDYPGELEMNWGKGHSTGGLYEWTGSANRGRYRKIFLLTRKVEVPKRPWRRISWMRYKPNARYIVAKNISKAMKVA